MGSQKPDEFSAGRIVPNAHSGHLRGLCKPLRAACTAAKLRRRHNAVRGTPDGRFQETCLRSLADRLDCRTRRVRRRARIGCSCERGTWWTSHPGGKASSWHYLRLGKTFGPTALDCDRAGTAIDCAVSGIDGLVWQGSHPTKGLGSADVDLYSLIGVSCWVNVQCAELDITGSVVTTAGATVTGGGSAFPADAAQFDGGGNISCAPFKPDHNPFCVTVDSNGDDGVAWTTNPTGGAWQRGRVAGKHDLDAIECPASGVCVALEGANQGTDGIGVSHNPAKGRSFASAWKSFKLPLSDPSAFEELSALTCESTTLCLVGGHNSKVGNLVYVSTHPSIRSSWHRSLLNDGAKKDDFSSATAIACPSTKLCVLISGEGRLVVGHRK
jgi:hypothetical protein